MLNKIPILTYVLMTSAARIIMKYIFQKTTKYAGLLPYTKYTNLVRFNLALLFSGLLTLCASIGIYGTEWFTEILLPLLLMPALVGYIAILLWLTLSNRFKAVSVFQARYESSNVKRSDKTGKKPAKTNSYIRLFINYIGFPLNLSALFIAVIFVAPAISNDRQCARLVSKEFNQGLRQSSYRLFLEKPIAGKTIIRTDHFDPLHYRNTGDSICAVFEMGLFGFKRVARYESP